MATIMDTSAYQGANRSKYAGDSAPLHSRPGGEIEPDKKNLSSMLCPLLSVLALGAVAIVAVSGQFPWFVAPLALFAFFSLCFLRG
jgi:hypothetical protein